MKFKHVGMNFMHFYILRYYRGFEADLIGKTLLIELYSRKGV